MTEPYNPLLPETLTITYGTDPEHLNTRSPEVTAIPTSQMYSLELTSLEPGTEHFYEIESRNRLDYLVVGMVSFVTEDDSEFWSVC